MVEHDTTTQGDTVDVAEVEPLPDRELSAHAKEQLAPERIDELTKKSVRYFWETRAKAKEKGKRSDQGSRSSVTAGKNLDGFVDVMCELIKEARVEGLNVGRLRKDVTLPGYLRPVKDWDLVLTRHGKLIAAIEFKSHIGPSFGNNFNNRNEEAMGSSIDIRTAIDNGIYGDNQPPPYLGWCILVEDEESSRRAIRMNAPHFQPMNEFKDASYLDRYKVLCRRLEEQKFYSSAAVVASPESGGLSTGEYSNMSDDTSFERFMRRFWEYLVSMSEI